MSDLQVLNVPSVTNARASSGGPDGAHGAGASDSPPTVREQQARILFALGVMHYRRGADLFAPERTASRLFDTVIHIAKGRGFKGGRKLMSAARYGKATARAMEHMRAACTFHTESEINLLLAQTSNWVHFRNTGRPMPGWTFRDPADVQARSAGAASGPA